MVAGGDHFLKGCMYWQVSNDAMDCYSIAMCIWALLTRLSKLSKGNKMKLGGIMLGGTVNNIFQYMEV